MTSISELMWNRLGLISKITKNSAGKPLGRTAIMKLLYFLNTLRGVPLDYNFRLYTYGPFDSDVLDDLKYTEALGFTEISVDYHQKGYGYQITAGSSCDQALEKTSEFLEKYKDDIEWVFSKFGSKSVSELELLSTIVFVDQEEKERGIASSVKEISEKVAEIKPHFPQEKIRTGVVSLQEDGLILSSAN